MIAHYLWFDIVSRPPPAGCKMPEYAVINGTSGETIGMLRWYGRWRQYCLFPEHDTVWSAGCLADIGDFIKTLMADYRRNQAARTPKAEASDAP